MADNVTTPLGPVKTTTLYAVVSGADILHGVGAVKADRTAEGKYWVKFNVDVSLGAFSATTENDGTDPRIINVFPDDDPTKVNIRTYNVHETLRDTARYWLTVTTAYGENSMT